MLVLGGDSLLWDQACCGGTRVLEGFKLYAVLVLSVPQQIPLGMLTLIWGYESDIVTF